MADIRIGINSVIADNVTFEGSATIGAFCIIGSAEGGPVIIGDGCVIEDFATVRPNVRLGAGTRIESHAVIGYDKLSRIWDEDMLADGLIIGANSLVRSHSVVYTGSVIGDACKIGHGAVVREAMRIGEQSVIGCLIKAEGYTRIGMRCVIHAQTHLTSFMTVGDYVFFGPGCITMNDPDAAHFRTRRRAVRGPTVHQGARIGSGAMLCPGVVIGEEAFIGAGAVVSREVPPRELWTGNPAAKARDVDPRDYLIPADDFERSLDRK